MRPQKRNPSPLFLLCYVDFLVEHVRAEVRAESLVRPTPVVEVALEANT